MLSPNKGSEPYERALAKLSAYEICQDASIWAYPLALAPGSGHDEAHTLLFNASLCGLSKINDLNNNAPISFPPCHGIVIAQVKTSRHDLVRRWSRSLFYY